jgi:hypothetical protein
LKNKNIFPYFYPIVALAISCLLVLFIREFSLLTFDSISFESKAYILMGFLSFSLGSVVAILVFGKGKIFADPVYSIKSVNAKANWIIFLSLVSTCLLIYKFLILSGGSFSLASITDLRLEAGRNGDHVKGSTLSGILGMIFSGFTIILYIYKEYFFYYLSQRKIIKMNLVFIGGVFTSFLSGGRWVVATALLVALIMYFLRKYTFKPRVEINKTYQDPKQKSSFLLMVVNASLLFIIIYIFSKIFLDRVAGSEDDTRILLNILANNFDGVSFPASHHNFLQESQALIPIYYVISLFQFYLGHGLYQFDALLNSDYPLNAPYLGAYQFYLQALMLNKLGFNIIPIEEILLEINPGVYNTIFGAFLLDFGYYGGVFLIFLISFLSSYFWIRFLRKRHFFDMYISVLYFILLLFSPVVAITSTGIYPSLLSLAFVLKLFIPRIRKGTSV